MKTNLFNDAIVRRTVTQAMVTVEGEQSLYDKLKPEIESVYQDTEKLLNFEAVIFPDGDAGETTAPMHPEIWEKVQDFIVLVSFANSIHGLDLILTPNGFGVVSNQTVAPASTARVEEYRKEQLSKARTLLCSLFYDLSRLEEWKTTEAYMNMSLSPLFYGEYISDTTFADGHNLAQRVKTDQTLFTSFAIHIDRIYMGIRFAQSLRDKAIANELSQKEFRLFQQYKALCRMRADTPASDLDKFPFILAAENLIDLLLDEPAEFAEWHASTVGQSYINSPKFQNDKSKGGTWL